MFKYYFEQIQNVAIWPIISLTIFFGFFMMLIWWLFKVDGGYISKMKNLPLEDDKDLKQGRSNKKKGIAILLTLLLPQMSFGQSEVSTTWNEETLLLWVLIFVIIIALLVLMVAIYTLNVLQVAMQKPKESASIKKESRWQQFWDRFNKSVPKEREADVLLDHNYDGIRELDNHLPPWWTAMFYLGIVIGIVYMLVYHVFESAPLPAELYEIEMAEANANRSARLAVESEATGTIDESTVTYDETASALTSGQKIYDMQCASCHRDDGGGNIGPNLTDAYWIHGGSIQSIFRSIKYGIPQKGMISWEPILSPLQMSEVSSYIVSLSGTNPEQAKGPQGDLYEENAP